MVVDVLNLGMETASLMIAVAMLVSNLLMDHRRRSSKIYVNIIWLLMVLLLNDIFFNLRGPLNLPIQLGQVFAALDYFLCCLLAASYHLYLCAYLEENGAKPFSTLERWFVLPLGVLDAGACIIGAITNAFYRVTEQGIEYTDMIHPAALISTVILGSIFFIVKKRLSVIIFRERLTLSLYIFLPIFFSFVDAQLGTVFQYSVTVALCCLNLMNMVMRQEEKLREQERRLRDTETQLNETRLNALQLQMNPHFIYNTLTSIYGLCYKDGEQAAKYIGLFSKYLRNNFGELANRNLIFFWEEIKHLELYLSIEKLRFPDMEVITDFQVMDFEIPSLTVQPLVENAIRHGIRGRSSGGTLRLTSRETEQGYVIRVEDDGIGFTDIPDDGRKHIGIQNVRTRLDMLCGGTLEITSTPGVGTVAEITVWKNGDDEDEEI